LELADEMIDVKGLSCPRPLVETQKKLRKMEVGKTLEVVGDHGPSKTEIPNSMRQQGQEILGITEEGNTWHIVIKKTK